MLVCLLLYTYRTEALRGYGLFRARLRLDLPVCREVFRLGVPVAGLVVLEAGLFMTVSILSSSRKHAPFGMAGGEDGEKGRNWVERADGSKVEMTGTDRCDVHPGDIFVVESPGGGGYGEPVAMKEAAE